MSLAQRTTVTLALVLCLAAPARAQLPPPLPRAQWPATVRQAVPLIIERLTPTQKALVIGTPKENLFMLQGEWGDDIESHLGLTRGNKRLLQNTCKRACTVDEATMLLMIATWEVLQR